jgi:hypothetical protein
MEITWWKDRINISKDICMVQRLQPSEPYANIIIYREFQGFSAMHHAGCWLFFLFFGCYGHFTW